MEAVKFDFQRAKQQEQSLEDIAVKLEQTIRGSYLDAVQELKEGWQSEGSKKFVEKTEILTEKMLGTADLIRQTKEALHRAYAKAAYIEEKAKEIAENRTGEQ